MLKGGHAIISSSSTGLVSLNLASPNSMSIQQNLQREERGRRKVKRYAN